MGYNKFILIGTVESEVEVRTGFEGEARRARFYLRTDKRLGHDSSRSDTFPIIVNSTLIIDFCVKNLKPGIAVMVEGWLRNWRDGDNEEIQIIANTVRRMDSTQDKQLFGG